MMTLTLENLLLATGGRAVVQGTTPITAGVVTDSRAIIPGCLFVALCGERFDGNLFAAEASRKGAAAVIVSRVEGDFDSACSVVQVEDTLLALQKLATWWRARLAPLHVVGLTGSSGKTSTKDMLFSILCCHYSAVATKGNLNNHIGVPLSILSTPEGTEAAVWEMGMNHAGELAPLCAMTQPQIGVITTIGSAHMEYLGSREAIAEEKCTVARCLPPEGFMIYPAADDFALTIAAQTPATPIPVGGEGCAVRAVNPRPTAAGTDYTLHIEGLGEIAVSLPVPGAHMVSNSLLAAAAGWKLGCSLAEIAAGLSSSSLTKGRLAIRRIGEYTVVDDTYNANPESMKAAMQTVADLPTPGRRIAVLGKMGELGSGSRAAHAEIGRFAGEIHLDALIVVGEECPETDCLSTAAADRVPRVASATTPLAAAALVKDMARPGDIILFKGSRSAGIERVIDILFPNL